MTPTMPRTMTVPRGATISAIWRLQPAVITFAFAAGVGAQAPAGATSRFRFVAEARQPGPVAYRDPLGVMSPDGQWLAYSSGGRLRLTHIAGGPVSTLGPRSNVLAIAWLPDSRRLAVRESDGTSATWSLVDVPDGARRPLWKGTFPKVASGADSVAVDPTLFRDIAWSRDGGHLAGIAQHERGSVLWIGKADGSQGRIQRSGARLAFPAWSLDGKVLACLIASQGKQYVSIPCGTAPGRASTRQAYGPVAFSPDGSKLYFASPNARGTVDLWVRPVGGSAATRVTSFTRDTYAPSVARDGRVLFGVQDYRTFIAIVPSGGGAVTQLTSFQSETPSWSRDDRTIGFTYGSWRRVIDDAHYPDIAQDLGVVPTDAAAPASAPSAVIRASSSEDQGLDWSPNGRWIVLHSHANGLDDVWIQPADGSAPARSITAGGYETGWPRWSPDGRWIAYSTEVAEGNRARGALFIVGVDSATGSVTRAARRVAVNEIRGDIDNVEWSPTSDSLVFQTADGPARAIHVVARDGGPARLVHRFTSEQQFSGIGVAPDFRWAAFIAPANDSHFQVFRVPLDGGAPTQVTFDPTDKTQPAVSRDGTRIAFTVFTYAMRFWVAEP